MMLTPYDIEQKIEDKLAETLEGRDIVELINCQSWASADQVSKMVSLMREHIICPKGYYLTQQQAIICLQKEG